MTKKPISIRQSALNALARRDYAERELAKKLKTKGYPTEEITPLIANLAKSGLINEHRFTENFIHWRRARGYGPLRISMELQERGIAEEMIAQLLDITDNNWLTDAQRVWQKQFKGNKPDDFKERAKHMRFLQYRGFTREQINSVFQETEFFT